MTDPTMNEAQRRNATMPLKKGQMTASEAVFGFAAWLTCRKEAITIGATHDAAPMADFVKRWCDVNNLPPVREGVYPHNITQPPAG